MKTSKRVLYILLPVIVLALLVAFFAGTACTPPGTMPSKCEQWYEKGKQEGYNTAYNEGYTKGKEEGMATGYNEGYKKGLGDGIAACPQCPTCPECPKCQYPYYYPYIYRYPFPYPPLP